MAVENQRAFAAWHLLKPDTEFAVRTLVSALNEPEGTPEEILDAYLFAKQTLAHSMQSLLMSQLPSSDREFQDVRARMQEEIRTRFGKFVPEKYLGVPYGTRSYAELFAVLYQRLGQPVDIALLRTVNGDDVHTERRIRELRELGLDVTSTTLNSKQHYTLASLDIDSARICELVFKTIKRSKRLSAEEKQEILKNFP